MNTVKTTFEQASSDQYLQIDEVLTLDSIEELSSVELAYVGGGTASVSFI